MDLRVSGSPRALPSALVEAAGREGVSDDPAVLAAAAVDGLQPRWVASPATVEGVAGVLALAAAEDLAVVVRGSGSSLDLGGPPARVDLVLDLHRLDRVLEDHPDDMTIGVEAGVRGAALAARLTPRRQWLPVDPPGWRGRTIGGMAATAASGPLRARYGTLRDLLLGVRFVQADGVVTWGGARVVKSVTGYDVPKLMVGSLGTLGVIVEATLRLHPMPEAEATWIVPFGGSDIAAAFVARVLDSTLQPNRLEYLDGGAQRACRVGMAPAAVAVAIGSVPEAVRAQGAEIEQLARRAGASAVAAPDDFWDRYDQACARGEVALRIGTLSSRLADTVRAVERALQAHGAAAGTALLAGSAAAGALRLVLAGPSAEGVVALVTGLRAFLADLEGHVVVHSGPRSVRERLDPWGPIEPEALALMRGLKQEFDPRAVLNPGRFVGGL
jgi:glycolate oxidase FAD binding subunit